jgi:hypothetical protein
MYIYQIVDTWRKTYALQRAVLGPKTYHKKLKRGFPGRAANLELLFQGGNPSNSWLIVANLCEPDILQDLKLFQETFPVSYS